MLREIKNWKTGEVIFSCDVPDDVVNKDLYLVCEAGYDGTDLIDADLRGWDLSGGEHEHALMGMCFDGSDCTGTNFSGTDLNEAQFEGTNLTDANMTDTNLCEAWFNGTIMTRTNFTRSYMAGIGAGDEGFGVIDGANFYDTDFGEYDIPELDFSKAINAPLVLEFDELGCPVIILSTGYMRIDDETNSISKWKNFTDDELDSMELLEFWQKNGTQILEAWNSYKHTPA